jgi:hypothetical protein
LQQGIRCTPPSKKGEEKGRATSETQVEILTQNILLLFDNQRDIEKYQILAYKT